MADLQRAFPTQEENLVVTAALAAVRSNDYAGGVLVLESVQRTPGVSPQQLEATQNALQAIMADLTARADRGDPDAKIALALIERTRSQ